MRLRIALAALGVVVAPAAEASPQILALLSTDGPVPMDCQGGVCTAELSAFCLEQARATPETGAAYRLAPNAALVLVVTGSDGTVREIDGGALAAFASLRDMTAVRVAVDRRALGDAARVAIHAGETASLVPVPSARDGTPHRAAEIEDATGPLRAAGAQLVDRSPDAAVARDLSRALNALRQEDETAALWRAGAATEIVRGCAAKVAEAKARRQATIGVRGFWTGRSIVAEPTLKACLEEAHGSLMTRLNQRFWKGELPRTTAPRSAPRT